MFSFFYVLRLRPFSTSVGIELRNQNSNHSVDQQKKKTEKLIHKISVHYQNRTEIILKTNSKTYIPNKKYKHEKKLQK
jgi:hypothetical protein